MLQKTVASIDFIKGLDQRTSPKLVLSGKLTTANNIIYRGKTVERRMGFNALPVVPGNPLLAGYVLGNSLAVQGLAFRFWSQQAQSWFKAGTGFELISIAKTSAYKGEATAVECAAATNNGYTAYLTHTQPTSSTDNLNAYVIDEATGGQVNFTLQLDTTTGLKNPRVVAFKQFLFATWAQTNTALAMSKFDTTNPSAGWTTSVLISPTNFQRPYDIVVFNSRCFIAFFDNVNNDIRIVEVNTGGTTIAGPVAWGFGLDTTAATVRIGTSQDGFLYVIAWQAGTWRRTIFNLALTITTANASFSTTGSTNGIHDLGYFSNTTSCDVYFHYDTASNLNSETISYITLGSGGTLGSVQAFMQGAIVASNPFVYLNRRYIWVFPYWGMVSGNPNATVTVGKSAVLLEDVNINGTSFQVCGQVMLGTCRRTSALGGGFGLSPPPPVSFDSSGFPWFVALEQFILQFSGLGTAGMPINTSAVGVSRITAKPNATAPLTRATLGGVVVQGGAMPQMFDGDRPVELGFTQYPELLKLVFGGGASGSLNSGGSATAVYQIALTYEWIDLQGNRWQSAPTSAVSTGNAATNDSIVVTFPYLNQTNKTAGNNRNTANIVVWQSAMNGSVLYRATSFASPIQNSVGSDTGTFTITTEVNQANEILYTAGALSNIAPPAASYVVSHQNRLFLGGMEDPNLIWFSRKYVNGSGINFNDTLTLRINPWGGPITGLASMDDKLVVFEQTAIAAVFGDGPNDLGANNTFSAPQLVSADIGCADARSIVSTPYGIFFLSNKGFYLLDRGLQLHYIGAQVENLIKPLGFSGVPAISSVQVIQNRHQIRWTLLPVGYFTPAGYVINTPGICLVLDYTDVIAEDAEQPGQDKFKWSTFDNYYAADTVIWQGNYTQIGTDNFVKVDSESAVNDQSTTTQAIVANIETGWIHLQDIQGFSRVSRLLLTGRPIGTMGAVSVSTYYDYSPNAQEFFNTGIVLGPGEPWQLRHKLAFKQKCESVKFQIQLHHIVQNTLSLENLALELGIKKGAFKLPAASTYA